jgi:protein kinase A
MKFPREFDKDAKSLVKHLCAHDISSRYGNMVGGVKDIKGHRFFKKFDFDLLLRQSL